MEKNECKHEILSAKVEENLDITATCTDCGFKLSMLRAKEGLYVFGVENNIYLLNTNHDINFEEENYTFQIGETIVTLKDHHKDVERRGYCKQICKNMKNSK